MSRPLLSLKTPLCVGREHRYCNRFPLGKDCNFGTIAWRVNFQANIDLNPWDAFFALRGTDFLPLVLGSVTFTKNWWYQEPIDYYIMFWPSIKNQHHSIPSFIKYPVYLWNSRIISGFFPGYKNSPIIPGQVM